MKSSKHSSSGSSEETKSSAASRARINIFVMLRQYRLNLSIADLKHLRNEGKKKNIKKATSSV